MNFKTPKMMLIENGRILLIQTWDQLRVEEAKNLKFKKWKTFI